MASALAEPLTADRGVLVRHVERASAAYRAGIVPGDRIHAAITDDAGSSAGAGTGPTASSRRLPIATPLELAGWALTRPASAPARLALLRDGREFEVELAPGSLGLDTLPAVASTLTEIIPLDHALGLVSAETLDMLASTARDWREQQRADLGAWLELLLWKLRIRFQGPELAAQLTEWLDSHGDEHGHPARLAGLLSIAEELFDNGAYREADQLLARLTAESGADLDAWPLHARVLIEQGRTAIYLGDTGTGVDRFESALASAHRSGDTFAAALALSWRGFGQLWRYANDEALETLSEADARIAAFEPDGGQRARSLLRLALLHRQMLDAVPAAMYAEHAARIAAELGDAALEARSRFERGVIASTIYRFREAEHHHRTALELVDASRPHASLRAYLLNSLGYVSHCRGNHDAADRYYRLALAVFEARAARPDMAFALMNLSYNDLYRKRYDEARDYGTRALELMESLDYDAFGLTSIRRTLAQIDLETGNLDAAERVYRHSFGQLAHLPEDAFARWDDAYSLGLIEAERGNCEAALTWLELALRIARRTQPASAYLAESLYHVARQHGCLGRTDAALEFLFEAIEVFEASELLLGGGVADQGAFRLKYEHYYVALIEALLADGRTPEAFSILERYRGARLRQLHTSDATVPIHVDDDVRLRTDALLRRHDKLLAELGTIDDTQPGVRDGLETELDNVRRALQRARDDQLDQEDPHRLIHLGMGRLQDAETIANALGAGDLLLAYLVLEGRTWLFALTQGALRAAPIELRRDELIDLIGRYRLLLAFTRPNATIRDAARALGSDLHDTLLGPVAAELAEASRLIVVPDGALHALPIASLVSRRPDGEHVHLIERLPVLALQAAGEIAGTARPRRNPSTRGPQSVTTRPVVVFAYGAEDAADARPEVPSLQPLRHVGEEALEVARYFAPDSLLFTGPAATEAAVRAHARHAGVLHFASHARINESNPMDSWLVLHPDPGAGDNGLLQSWEVARFLELDADLVTLAACDTLLGREYSGLGLLGLHSAFLAAGARTVLGALWSVSDQSTSRLMQRFYFHHSAGAAPELALQRAQLEEIVASKHAGRSTRWRASLSELLGLGGAPPVADMHWAAFQLTGWPH